MSGFSGILVNALPRANPEDTRGAVYEWCRGLSGQQVSIYNRGKDKLFGDHFHKGDDPSKNPERFFLARGRVRVQAWNPAGEELDIEVDEGSEILIDPGVLHRFTPLEDVIFLEYRCTVFDRERPDSYPAEYYADYLKGRSVEK